LEENSILTLSDEEAAQMTALRSEFTRQTGVDPLDPVPLETFFKAAREQEVVFGRVKLIISQPTVPSRKPAVKVDFRDLEDVNWVRLLELFPGMDSKPQPGEGGPETFARQMRPQTIRVEGPSPLASLSDVRRHAQFVLHPSRELDPLLMLVAYDGSLRTLARQFPVAMAVVAATTMPGALSNSGLEETPGPGPEGDLQDRLRAQYRKMVGGDPAFFELYLTDATLRYGGDPQKVWEEVSSTLGTAAIRMKGPSFLPSAVVFVEARERLNQIPQGRIADSELPWVLDKSPREVDRFRRLREVSGYDSAHSLEKAAGLAWSVVSRYEEGKRGLGFRARKKLQRFFEEKTGISLTLSFRVRPANLGELINGIEGTDQRLSRLLNELLGWSYRELIDRANALRPKDESPVPPETNSSFDDARPWTRRWIRNALEQGLQEQYGARVLLDGHLRAQRRSVQEVLRDLPTFEDRFNWLVDDWLIWSRSELIRRAGHPKLSVGVRTFLKPPTQHASRSRYRTRLREVLVQGLAERGDPIALDEQLLPAAGLEERFQRSLELEGAV
jgi:hypothetical protein